MRRCPAEARLSRGWGPGSERTFEQWIDELNGAGREALDEALAEQSVGLAVLEPNGFT
jgi:hypothetical protein